MGAFRCRVVTAFVLLGLTLGPQVAAQTPSSKGSRPSALPLEPALKTAIADTESVLPADACQIHVWSTSKIKSYVTGFSEAMAGGILGAALDGNRANQKTVEGMLREALEGRPQATLLARLDLSTLLGMPSATLFSQRQTTAEAQWKAAKGRLSSSFAPCYSEIIVRDMYFLKSALFPPTIRVNFTVRDFRGGRTTPLLTQGRGGVALKFYPTVSTTDTSVMTRGFEDAYVASFEEFLTEQKKKGMK